MTHIMGKTIKRVEISRRKVETTDGFQAVDPIGVDEEPEIAKYYNVEEEDSDGAQKQKDGVKEKRKK